MQSWGTFGNQFDLNADGVVGVADMDQAVGAIDMGQICAKSADLNASMLVDQADLDILVGPSGQVALGCINYFATRAVGPNNPCDLNGDVLINSADLALLISRWGSSG